MTFNLNAQSSVSSFAVGSLVTVTEGMSTLDALVLEPTTTVLGAVYLYDLSNKYDSNLFEYKPLTIHAISDSGLVWKTNIDIEGEFDFSLADGIWSFDIEFHDAMVVENYLVDYETMNPPNNFVDTINLVLNSNYNADLDLSTNPYIGIQFADLDCDNFEDVGADLNGFQPSPDRKKLFLHYNNSENSFWSNFANQDNESVEVYTEEVDDGTINIDLRFRMEPTLAKRIYMDPDGLFRGSFDILVEGDWTNGDNQGACDQNQCEELNITLMAGPNKIDTHHETGLTQGQNTVVFNFGIDETTPIDWDGGDFNPEILVTMKLAGNYNPGWGIFAPTGDPAKFEMSMGEQSSVEFPISPSANKSINYSPEINDVRCAISNPTQYIEKVEISTSTNYPVSLLSIDEVYVGPNSEEEFSIFVSVDENFLENYYLTDEYWVYTNDENYLGLLLLNNQYLRNQMGIFPIHQ